MTLTNIGDCIGASIQGRNQCKKIKTDWFQLPITPALTKLKNGETGKQQQII